MILDEAPRASRETGNRSSTPPAARLPRDTGLGLRQTLTMPLARRDLINLFGRACDLGNGTLFVGAGLSMGAGLPSWGELLEQPRSESEVPAIEDLPLMAEYILSEGKYSRPRLEQHILEATAAVGVEPTAALKHLVRLPVDQIWTTNYDPFVERTRPQRSARVIATDDDIRLIGTSERSIVKMHGSVTASTPPAWLSPPVITRTDYETYETEHPRMWALLRAVYLSRTMLFLGFSFSDPNIEVLQRLARLSGTAAKDRHVAVLGRPTEDGSDKRRHHELRVRDLEGSGVLVYEIDDHQQLTEILSDLVRRTRMSRLFVSGSNSDEDPDFERLTEALARELVDRAGWETASLGGHAGWNVTRTLGTLRRAEGCYDPSKLVLHYRRREGEAPPATLDERVGTAVFSDLDREPLVQGVLDESRAVVVVRGGSRTTEEVNWALGYGAGVVPIASSGGAAHEYWQRHRAAPPDLGGQPTDPEEWERLNSPEPAIAARAAARLLDQAMYHNPSVE